MHKISSRLRAILTFIAFVLLTAWAASAYLLHQIKSGASQAGAVISKISKQKVIVESADADYQWLSPRLVLNGISIGDNGPRIESAKAVLSWSSLLAAEPIFSELSIDGGKIVLVREQDGSLVVQGLAKNKQPDANLEEILSKLSANQNVSLSGLNIKILERADPGTEIEIPELSLSLAKDFKGYEIETIIKSNKAPLCKSHGDCMLRLALDTEKFTKSDIQMRHLRALTLQATNFDASAIAKALRIPISADANSLDVKIKTKPILSAEAQAEGLNAIALFDAWNVAISEANISLSDNAFTTQQSFDAQAKSISLTLPKFFQEPLFAQNIHAKASAEYLFEGLLNGNEKFSVSGLDVSLSPGHENAILAVRGSYAGIKDPLLNLTVEAKNFPAQSLHNYFPAALAQTSEWLRRSLLAGSVAASAKISGKASKFPYRNPSDGVFLVEVNAVRPALNYSPVWPELRPDMATLVFDRNSMKISASGGNIGNSAFSEGSAILPDLSCVRCSPLTVKAKAQGPLASMLKSLEKPLDRTSAGEFFRGFSTIQSGKANLTLELNIPILDANKTTYSGKVTVEPSVVKALPFMPEHSIEQTSVDFDNAKASFQTHGKMLGGSYKADGTINIIDNKIDVNVQGVIQSQAGLDHLGLGTWVRSPSAAPFKGAFVLNQGPWNAKFFLAPTTLSVPGLLASKADSVSLEIDTSSAEQRIEAYSDRFRVKLRRKKNGSGWLPVFAGMSVGSSENIKETFPKVIRIRNRELDADELERVSKLPSLDRHNKQASQAASEWLPQGAWSLDLEADRLRAFGMDFKNVSALGYAAEDKSTMTLSSDLADGKFEWEQKNNHLTLKLSKLDLDRAKAAPDLRKAATANPSWPAISAHSDNVRLFGRTVGKVTLEANPGPGVWNIGQLDLDSDNLSIKSSGRWNTQTNRTSLKIEARSDSLNKAMALFGLGGLIEAEEAAASLTAEWNGSPSDFAIPIVKATGKIEAKNGNINKIEPGAAKILSFLSLQSIPRRILFDFKDIFGKGLNFTEILCDASIADSVAHANPLIIHSSAADIRFDGSLDLSNENLNGVLLVKPEVSNLTDIIGFAGGPIAGAATFALQKLLGNPVNKAFERSYRVGGNLDKPQLTPAQ